MRSSLGKIAGSVALLLVVVGWFTFASATGSGSITSGKRLGIGSSFSDNPVAGVRGLGQVQASCTPGPSLHIRYHNSSTRTVVLAGEFDANKVVDEVGPGFYHDELATTTVSTFLFQLTQESSSRRPQAFVAVSTLNTGATCDTAMVSAVVTRP